MEYQYDSMVSSPNQGMGWGGPSTHRHDKIKKMVATNINITSYYDGGRHERVRGMKTC
jgi:hypothetical protein